jgi:hypothetical protein
LQLNFFKFKVGNQFYVDLYDSMGRNVDFKRGHYIQFTIIIFIFKFVVIHNYVVFVYNNKFFVNILVVLFFYY